MKFLLLLAIGVFTLSIVTQHHLPRGIRNNNPGNIRRNGIQWEGMQAIQNDEDFVQFDSPQYGFRAMARILRSYEARGINTIKEIISTYAPANENATDNYISFVAERLQIAPDTTLSLDAVMPDLIQAMAVFENGRLFADFYDSATIAHGVALA